MPTQQLSKEDIEEIISDTFFILWKNQNKLDKSKEISPYIAGITRNLVKEKIRALHIHTDIADHENQVQVSFKIDMFCEQREKIAIINKTLESMKKVDIEIFELYYYSSMKYNEIAKILNISAFSIKFKLFRIRNKIKKELLKRGYSDEK
jgi:RNA polymerase sigma-70 factor (ECF subfamily)